MYWKVERKVIREIMTEKVLRKIFPVVLVPNMCNNGFIIIYLKISANVMLGEGEYGKG
jgi:hypothetical protein